MITTRTKAMESMSETDAIEAARLENMSNLFDRVNNQKAEAQSEALKGMTPEERYFAFFSEIFADKTAKQVA